MLRQSPIVDDQRRPLRDEPDDPPREAAAELREDSDRGAEKLRDGAGEEKLRDGDGDEKLRDSLRMLGLGRDSNCGRDDSILGALRTSGALRGMLRSGLIRGAEILGAAGIDRTSGEILGALRISGERTVGEVLTSGARTLDDAAGVRTLGELLTTGARTADDAVLESGIRAVGEVRVGSILALRTSGRAVAADRELSEVRGSLMSLRRSARFLVATRGAAVEAPDG